MNIVVLVGGTSTERDVSFSTGRMVSRALRENGHRVIMLDVFLGHRGQVNEPAAVFDHPELFDAKEGDIPEQAPDIAQIKKLRGESPDGFFGPNVIRICQAADFVFLALHGENGENGKIQAAFDLLGVRYTGSGYLSSALAMDKGIAKKMFEAAGIPTPCGVCLQKGAEGISAVPHGVPLPCVVKPCCGGSSIGVSIARTQEEFEAAIETAFACEDALIVEEYICGREFSVGVIANRALPVIEIAPVEGFYDYRNKYKAGSAIETCPADLPPEVSDRMQQIALQVCETLGLDTYCRMDFLLNEKEEIFCLEANTLPGMTPTSLLPQEAAAVGIDFNGLCELLIEISKERYEG